MQSLRNKGKHTIWIFIPLAITLLVTLDVSEGVNELLQINLETKDDVEDVNDCDSGQPLFLLPADHHDESHVRLDEVHQVPEIQEPLRMAIIQKFW